MDPNASRQHSLLPAIAIKHASFPQSRHCNDPTCFIRTRSTQAERWAAFDAFDPRQIEEEYGLSFTASPIRNAVSSSSSSSCTSSSDEEDINHTLTQRRIRRAAELRTRAKARLMPPYDHRRTHPDVVLSSKKDKRNAFRTPSPPPSMTHRQPRRDYTPFSTSPSTPRTPIRVPHGSPASTVAHRSPAPTPLLPAFFNCSSP